MSNGRETEDSILHHITVRWITLRHRKKKKGNDVYTECQVCSIDNWSR